MQAAIIQMRVFVKAARRSDVSAAVTAAAVTKLRFYQELWENSDFNNNLNTLYRSRG